MQPHYRLQFDAQTLLRDHPPYFRNVKKSLLFDLAYPDRRPSDASIEVTRWPAAGQDQPVSFDASMTIDLRPDFFDYRPADDPQNVLEWHLNFADTDLFYAYGSALFAQDEIQVAEHPLLASVRQAILARKLDAATADRTGPTPVLVRNVERRLNIATDPNPSAGRPHGLYGNHFAAASTDAIRNAARPVDPPTFSNILAMAAPAGGFGTYTPEQIEGIFLIAYTAFRAAVHESTRDPHPDRKTLIHSGFWGCGVFGGNRTLMIALQTLAARAAGVNRLIFHTANPAGIQTAQRAIQTADQLAQPITQPRTIRQLAQSIARLGLRWGVGDGN